MAISTPVVIGTDGSNTSGTTSLKITVPAGGVPAGALINVAYVSTEGGGARSISDTAGNTYVRDFDEPNHPSADRQFILWRQENALALSAGDTIDISWGSSVTNNLATAWYTEGVDDTATPTTGTPSNNSYASTRFPNSGNTTTTDAEAILFGMVGGGFNSFFPHVEDTAFTTLSAEQVSFNLLVAYRQLSATETRDYEPEGALNTSGWVSIIGYKASAVVPPSPGDLTPVFEARRQKVTRLLRM